MKKLLSLASCLMATLCVSCAIAQEFTSVDEVKKDGKFADALAIQGEYELADKDADFPFNTAGYQIIARGVDEFDVIGYQDGLPGQGWDRSKARFIGQGKIEDGKLVVTGVKMNIPRKANEGKDVDVIFNEEQKARKLIGTIEDGKYYLQLGDKKVEMKKVERKSETLGKPAPKGAIQLFDGQNTDAFATEVKLSTAQKDAFWSEARLKPFEKDRPYLLHIEFFNSFMPTATGQARSNSGVYIQEEYECQVLDSFGLEGENNECGGFYQQLKPLVNMCYPPLTWQTYDFDVTPAKFNDQGEKVENAKITVKHNGVVIHDNAELQHETPGYKNEKNEAGEARGLYLQGHGNKVQYRNIWIQYK
ncbi:MAG: DUF1080 domain-containing protein [Planctomycetia bacterium]|nr:DUF1080 domain-containing protein [Planctomycetia bacterium]